MAKSGKPEKLKKTTRAVGYIRVSTDAQAGEDKYGIDAQQKEITDYCYANNITLMGWYIDKGKSGAKEDRPEFDKLIYSDNVANPPVEAVVVAKSDRVARDINIYFYYKHELLKKNIKLISVSEDFGKLGMLSSALEALVLTMAQMERENINKRTTAGRMIKAHMGGYSGGKIPYGYKLENKQCVVDEDEAAIVIKVFTLMAEGWNFHTVAEYLNSNGFVSRKGGQFYPSSIRSIFNNRKFYEGYYRYGDMPEYVKGLHEPIFEEGAFVK